jgi:hypothetical protein
MEKKSLIYQPLPPIKQLLNNENTNSVRLPKFCFEENRLGSTEHKKTETRNLYNNKIIISYPQKEQYKENPTLKPLKIKKPGINTEKAKPKQQKWVFEENIFQKRGRKGKQLDWKINIKKVSGPK